MISDALLRLVTSRPASGALPACPHGCMVHPHTVHVSNVQSPDFPCLDKVSFSSCRLSVADGGRVVVATYAHPPGGGQPWAPVV